MNRFEEERRKAFKRVEERGGDVSKICKTPSEFLDRLTNLFAESDPNETTEEMAARLTGYGINVEDSVEKIKKLVIKLKPQ